MLAQESLEFLLLPVPQISHSLPTSTLSGLLFSVCLDSSINDSLQIEKLPIENARFKFLSDVLPQNIDLDDFNFKDDIAATTSDRYGTESYGTWHLEQEAEVPGKEKEERFETAIISETLEIEVPKKSNGVAIDKNTHEYEVIQFETPELDVCLGNVPFLAEKIRILSEVPEIENSLELKPGFVMQFSRELQDSVLTVKDITLEHAKEPKTNFLEDDCSPQEQNCLNQTTYPLVEVDEMVLGSPMDISLEDKLLSVFHNIDNKNYIRESLDTSGKELLDSKEHLSDNFLSSQCLGSQLDFKDDFQDMDLTSMLEVSYIRVNSALPGKSDINTFLLDNPVTFQEFQILDLDLSQNFDGFFKGQTANEAETCDSMFGEDMNFKNFDKLIVVHELALVDDTFKSLPVPILSDHKSLKSLCGIIEETFAGDLKPQSLSALDGIYLDWNLLQEDIFNTKIYDTMFEGVGSVVIDLDGDSLKDEKVVYDFVLSDDVKDRLDMDNNVVSQELLADESMFPGTMTGVSSGKLSGFDFPQSGNDESLPKRSAERALMLFKSMSQFNDLDFFLNPQKATTKEHSDEAVKINATFPKVTSGESIAAATKGGEYCTLLPSDVSIDKQENLRKKGDKIHAEVADEEEGCNVPYTMESQYVQRSMESIPERVIIVNTQNLDKEMIVSRRSTYQKILAMEKQGIQVVERDSDLPVDIIISSSTCLVWYDCRNIGTKTTAVDEASSCLPLCIEDIATNVLTQLSFTFSGCILVFEGENSFLSTVMESSDGLYAAAATLGIDMQLFCSYSSELTDEIILSCIGNEADATRGTYPRMPESESLAESFLTKFPSINPLTAQAILSSGGVLIEFLEWSHECRIRAIQKYHVPDESIALFSASCKYGEREDSKSIMTDCSSSVSSGPDSGRFNLNFISDGKKRKHNRNFDKPDMQRDDLVHLDQLYSFPEDIPVSSVVPKPKDSWMSNDPELSEKYTLGQEKGWVRAGSSYVASKPYEFQISKLSKRVNNERKNSSSSFNDKLSGQRHVPDMDKMNNFELHDFNISDILHEDKKGEVIDLTGSPVLQDDISNMEPMTSSLILEKETNSVGRSTIARRLSFGKSSKYTFLKNDEFYSGSDMWDSVENQKKSSLDRAIDSLDVDFGNDYVHLEPHNKLLGKNFNERSAGISQGLQSEENSHSGGTPLSNALRSATSQQNSPWTMEFLNRIKEKSQLRQKSLPPGTSTPYSRYSGNVSKVAKRRSPSILEFFKYQGGSTPRKTPGLKRQKQSIQSSTSLKNERANVSIHPMQTPADKIAKQTLSFTTKNGGSQTKLVWSEGTHGPSKKY